MRQRQTSVACEAADTADGCARTFVGRRRLTTTVRAAGRGLGFVVCRFDRSGVLVIVAAFMVALLLPAASGAAPKTYTVSSTADTNTCTATTCTLRGAINAANANAGKDTIVFSVRAGSAIKPGSALPTITGPVVIDGTSRGCSGAPAIALNGSRLGGTANGLTIAAGATTVCGLVVQAFGGSGIRLSSGGGGSKVLGNYIGTNAAGTAALGNGFGVTVLSANNTIGGTAAGARNVVSGNSRRGVAISGAGATGNQLLGNYIGTNAAGTAALGNGEEGVFISDSPSNTVGGSVAGARNVISGNIGDGVFIGSGADFSHLFGNYIGTNAAGTAALGNGNGVDIRSTQNTIGLTATVGARNVVSGNIGRGIVISGAGANRNSLLGNYIGTDAAGTAALGNGEEGVFIDGAPSNTVGGLAGAPSVISGNTGAGVFIFGSGAAYNQLAGNYIGTNAAGSAALGNGYEGIVIDGSPSNMVGGTAVGHRNVVSGNISRGVVITGAGASGNQLLGNYIGTDAAGTAALGNGEEGVFIDGAPGNIVGVAGAARNVISGNTSTGVYITGGAANNQLAGNYIGTNAVGSAGLGNGFEGIVIDGSPSNIVGGTTGTTLGGPCTGACNLISGSGLGIYVRGGAATGNRLSGNSILDNDDLGIDLGGDGVTPNGSGPTGPNSFQNYPVLSAATSGGGTTVTGTLPGSSGPTYHLEFFDSPSCDPSGNGEGKVFLGWLDSVSANSPFSFTSPAAAPPGDVVTATATDPGGNTSEFSQCVPVKTNPTISTTLSQTTITAGGHAHDSASLSGATGDASGTVTYSVYDNSSCSGSPVASGGTKTVTSSAVPDSDDVTFNSAGSFYWQASYSGDAKNESATSSCTSEQLTVTSAAKIFYLSDGVPDASVQGLWAMDPNGANNARIASGVISDAVPSPNGSKVAYTKQNPTSFAQELRVIEADGSNECMLYSLGGNGVTASWSPDSSKLIFATAYETQPGHFVSKAIIVNAATNPCSPNPTLLLSNDPAGEIAPAFSPNGQWVIFKDNFGRVAAGRYYRVDADGSGSNLTPLDQISPYGNGGVVWSPDSAWFYFVSGSSTIYRASTDPQSQSFSIVTSDLSDGSTRWSLSPEGDRIAFTTRLNTGKPVTGVVNVDGTGYLQLTLAYAASDPAGCYSPVWSPTGADVIMHCYPGSGAISIYEVSSTTPTPVSPTFVGGQFRSREPVYAGLRPTR
jgi:hypothetical protein